MLNTLSTVKKHQWSQLALGGVSVEEWSQFQIATDLLACVRVRILLLQITFFNYFYWRIVDLQCCVIFCCSAKWINYIYTYIHSFRFYSHIVITEYWVEFPVLYSRSLLVIYFIYNSVYMSIPMEIIWDTCISSALSTCRLEAEVLKG